MARRGHRRSRSTCDNDRAISKHGFDTCPITAPRAENAKINVTDEPYFGTQIVCNYLPFSKAAKGAQGGPQQYATFVFCNFHFSDDQSRWQLLEGQIIAHFLGRSYDLHIYFGIFCRGCKENKKKKTAVNQIKSMLIQ